MATLAGAALAATPLDAVELRQILSALRRRRVVQEDDGNDEEFERLTVRVQQALGELRVRARAENSAQYVEKSKVRAAILRVLVNGPATPTAIATNSPHAPATVSRALKKLRDEGLVHSTPDPRDKRQFIYELSDEGEAQAAEVVAFTPDPAPQPPVSHEIVAAALSEALDAAVSLRRRTCHRKDVLARLKAIAEHAERASTPDVLVRTLNEILTTLRQDGQVEAYEHHLEQLKQIATAKDEAIPARSALRALAYLEYQLGRHPRRTLPVKAGHLVSAHNQFRRISDDADGGYWHSCEGWAHAALADNYRQQSTLDAAIRSAASALAIFEAHDDPYGSTRCRFLLGFCLRLTGHFQQAQEELLQARRMAEEHSFRAFRADSLMQLGEVYRCLGRLEEAWTSLIQAREEATELGLTMTSAFADTALAATMHQQGRDQGDALERLDRAQDVFEERCYNDGLALSLRRRAVVLREGVATEAGLDTAQACVNQARELYTTIMSPAGIAACHIEDGLLATERGEATDEPCEQLVALCKRPMMGYWIERDPWVPTMLDQFATHTGHQELLDVATGLLKRNARLTRERAATPVSNGARCAKPRKRLQVDHMGGEHRCVSLDSMAAAFTDDFAEKEGPSQPLEVEWLVA